MVKPRLTFNLVRVPDLPAFQSEIIDAFQELERFLYENITSIEDSGSGTGSTPEEIQDAVGAMLVDSPTINFVYSDAGNTETGHVLGIEARTDDPASPPNGRMWLRTDL